MVYNELNYQKLKGVSSDLNFISKATTYTANLNNQFSFKKGYPVKQCIYPGKKEMDSGPHNRGGLYGGHN